MSDMKRAQAVVETEVPPLPVPASGFVLSPAELADYTGKERPSAQARALDHMGIPYRTRLNGTLAVLRIHVETFDGETPADRLQAEPQLMD